MSPVMVIRCHQHGGARVGAGRHGSHVWRGNLGLGQGLGEASIERSNASWVIVTWGPPCGQTDTPVKYYLPATLMAGGENEQFDFKNT